MGLLPLAGHHSERLQVRRAIAAGRLPQLLLLIGPQGVGKQRFGLWIAQALLCEGGGEPPCGSCRPCRQIEELAHPDLHWFMPVARPKAGSPDKQVDELEEGLAAVLEARRKEPLYGPPGGLEAHFVSTARLIQRRAALTPVAGRRKVFLVAEADRLVPQEASPEAANSLLKLLEEPPADSQFILTVVDPNRMIPTLRSRSVPLRLGRLPDSEIVEFLQLHAGMDRDKAQHRAPLAQGSIGQALETGEERTKGYRAAEEFLRAVVAGPAERAERSLKQGTWQARGEFTLMLDALSHLLSEAGRTSSGLPHSRAMPDGLNRTRDSAAFLLARQRVAVAREAAQGNVNPQLLLAALADDLAEVL